jgi:hypothetical protein
MPPNSYGFTGIKNAVGASFNDWIRAASGSTIEGAAGADHLFAKAMNGIPSATRDQKTG